MFTASYPASFLPEEHGKGFHVRFPDLTEALTGGDDIEDTFVQAADCLAEAIAGRIARGDEIPSPSKPRRGQHVVSVPLQHVRAGLALAQFRCGILNCRLPIVDRTVWRRLTRRGQTASEATRW
jgi:predicted RNase H-like HicB family nuclease